MRRPAKVRSSLTRDRVRAALVNALSEHNRPVRISEIGIKLGIHDGERWVDGHGLRFFRAQRLVSAYVKAMCSDGDIEAVGNAGGTRYQTPGWEPFAAGGVGRLG